MVRPHILDPITSCGDGIMVVSWPCFDPLKTTVYGSGSVRIRPGSIWIRMAPYGYVRFRMDPYGSVLDLYGSFYFVELPRSDSC